MRISTVAFTACVLSLPLAMSGAAPAEEHATVRGNTPPVANDDNVSTFTDTPITISPLGNDFDPDGQSIFIIGADDPPNGSVGGDSTTIEYTPNTGFTGVDSFVYGIADTAGAQDFATVTVTVSDRPGETCENAIEVGSLPFSDTGSTSLYRNDYDEICDFTGSSSPDIVYVFRPTETQLIDISLCDDSAFDTKLYVFEDECPEAETPPLPTGTSIACNDDFCSTPSLPFTDRVSRIEELLVRAGRDYYIVIDGTAGNSGAYTLDITQVIPSGEDCDDAFLITSLPFSADGTTAGFNNDYDEVCPFDTSTAPDAVYRFDCNENVRVTVSLCRDTAYDSKVYVYENTCPISGSGPSGFPIGCNDDACTTPSFPGNPWVSEITNLALFAGNTYYFVVDGFGFNAGNYTLDITYERPQCPTSTALSQLPHLPDEPWTFNTSDEGTDFQAFDEYALAPGTRIDFITFWGTTAANPSGLGFEPASESPLNVRVRFYEDSSGEPGTLVQTFTAALAGEINIEGSYFGFDLRRYELFLFPAYTPPSNGWISIEGFGGDPDSWFLWASSPSGNGNSITVDRFSGLTIPSTPEGDRAFCFQRNCPADVDGNGMTETADITFIVSNLGAGFPGAPFVPGDADGDGFVTTADITFAVSNLGCGN